MKHKIKKWSPFRAGCTRPGCIAGIEGGIDSWSNDDLKKFFADTDCPGVFMKDSRNPTHEEKVDYLLKRADEEIKSWQKLKKYWIKLVAIEKKV